MVLQCGHLHISSLGRSLCLYWRANACSAISSGRCAQQRSRSILSCELFESSRLCSFLTREKFRLFSSYRPFPIVVCLILIQAYPHRKSLRRKVTSLTPKTFLFQPCLPKFLTWFLVLLLVITQLDLDF